MSECVKFNDDFYDLINFFKLIIRLRIIYRKYK